MWSSVRQLTDLVVAIVHHKKEEKLQDLETALRKFKPVFLNLLQNKPKNTADRTSVKDAQNKPLNLPGAGQKITLTEDFIDESLIISDLFSINELQAVELLLAGEGQQPSYPDLTRGLVTVLLYYDSRKCIVETLQMLLEARNGRLWSADVCPDVVALVHTFTDQLWKEGQLMRQILSLLAKDSLEEEIARLENYRALGGPRHRDQFRQLYTAIRVGLSECLLLWSCQTAFTEDEMVAIMDHLRKTSVKASAALEDSGLDEASANWKYETGHRKVKRPTTMEVKGNVIHDEVWDKATVHILMAALYSMDPSVGQNPDDEEDMVEYAGKNQLHPIFTTPTYISRVNGAVEAGAHSVPEGGTLWSFVQFAWSLSLSQMLMTKTETMDKWEEIAEQNVQRAINNSVFEVMRQCLLRTPDFHTEALWFRRTHAIVTDFLVLMPLRVNELRKHGDEEARIVHTHTREGFHPPTNLCRHFETLMSLIGEVYTPAGPLQADLCADFWSCTDLYAQAGDMHQVTRRGGESTYRQMSLFKFVRLAGNMLVSPSLYIPYIGMLTGISASPETANLCFGLLKTVPGSVPPSLVSWDHFFDTLHNYLSNLRQKAPVLPTTHHQHMYQITGPSLQHKSISPSELAGLVAVLRLIKRVALLDPGSRCTFVENASWQPLHLFFGLLSCSVPLVLKAELMETLAVFARDANIAKNVWRAFDASQILSNVTNSMARTMSGLQTEIDEREPNCEEYPLTLGFLRLVNSLAAKPSLHVFLSSEGFLPVTGFVLNTIFLKHMMRAYRRPEERWEVASACLELFDRLVSHFLTLITSDASSSYETFRYLDPGYQLCLLLLTESPLFKMIMFLIEQCLAELDSYIPCAPALKATARFSLQIIDRILDRETEVMAVVAESGSRTSLQTLAVQSSRSGVCGLLMPGLGAACMPLTMANLLMTVNPKSGKADYLPLIVRYTSFNSDFPEACNLSLSILTRSISQIKPHRDLLTILTCNQELRTELLRSFVDCLENETSEEASPPSQDPFNITTEPNAESPYTAATGASSRSAVLHILLASLAYPAPNLGHFLTGFRIDERAVARSNLQEAGVAGFPKTCLHALLSLIGSLSSQPWCMAKVTQLALACHIVNKLAAYPDSAQPTLRFLRGNRDFLVAQMPFLDTQCTDTDIQAILWNAKSWILKMLAIELRVSAHAQQSSYTIKLLKLLFGDDLFASDRSAIENIYCADGVGFRGTRDAVLVTLLEDLNLSETIELPDWSTLKLDLNVLEELLVQCEERTPLGVRLVNPRRLEATLIAQMDSVGPNGSFADSRYQNKDQLQQIPELAAQRNAFRLRLHAGKQACLEGIRQIIEVVFTTGCAQHFSLQSKRQCLVEFLKLFLQLLSTDNTPSIIRLQLSGTVLTLASVLTRSWSPAQQPGNPSTLDGGPDVGEHVALLDTTGERGGEEQTVARIRTLLRLLSDSIGQTKACSQRIRANLYGALLFFLRVATKMSDLSGDSPLLLRDESVLSRSALDLSGFISHSRLDPSGLFSRGQMDASTVLDGGLCERVCKDIMSGHGVSRMAGLGVVEALLCLDKTTGHRLAALNKRGHIEHFTESVVEDCARLQSLLNQSGYDYPDMGSTNEDYPGNSLATLFLYQSKMALLCRIALTSLGSQALLSTGIMTKLAECAVFSMRPPSDLDDDQEMVEETFPDWKDIQLPVLRLALNLMTSLGGENVQASQQVMHFVSAHLDTLLTPFSPRADLHRDATVKELGLTTAIIHLLVCARPNYLTGIEGVHNEGVWSRIERAVFSLIGHLVMLEPLPSLHSQPGPSVVLMESARAQLLVHLMAICSASHSTSNCGANWEHDVLSQTGLCVFTPRWDPANTTRGFAARDIAPVISSGRPGIGLLIIIIRHSLDSLALIDDLATPIDNLTTEIQSVQIDKATEEKRRALLSVIEHCIFLLWRHISLFISALQSTVYPGMSPGMTPYQPTARRLQDPPMDSPGNRQFQMSAAMSAGVSGKRRVDLDLMRELIPECITPQLLDQIIQAVKIDSGDSSNSFFIEVMVHRLRRIAQHSSLL